MCRGGFVDAYIRFFNEIPTGLLICRAKLDPICRFAPPRYKRFLALPYKKRAIRKCDYKRPKSCKRRRCVNRDIPGGVYPLYGGVSLREDFGQS